MEAALRLGDELRLQRALAAGADPNRPDARGIPPLGQVWESGWVDKICERLERPRRERVQSVFWRKWTEVRERLMNHLVKAGADPDSVWLDPDPESPGHLKTLPQCMLYHEIARYQQGSVNRYGAADIEKSLARFRPWLPHWHRWMGYNQNSYPNSEPPYDQGTVLDDLEIAFYMEANEPDIPEYDPAVHVMLARLFHEILDHHPPLLAIWLAQGPYVHVFPDGDEAFMERYQAQQREKALVNLPTPRSSARHRVRG